MNIISGFGYEAEEAGRVADVLAKGASSANTNVAQLGDAMATVAPVASALGLDVEGLTAAVGFMSDAGIQGSQAGRMLRQGLLRLSSPTGEAAALIEELGINVFDADGNMKAMDEVVRELENGLDGMSAQAQTAALSTLFGSESTAGWTALLERGGDELGSYTKELENAEGAAAEMAETMQDNARGKIVEFQSALEGIGIALAEHMIPAVTDAVEWGTELVRKFGELDDSTQETIVKMGLFAAAIGPAAIVAGQLTSAVGGILRVGGRLSGLLGKAGGAGLLGRIGLLGAGSATPVGLAIAGVGALAGGAYYLYQNMNELHDVSTETADAMMEQYQANIPLIESFDELREKSGWTNDEFGYYLDLQSRLERESNPDAIEAIKDEMEQLQKESGLSNEELEAMIQHNNDIVVAIPEATEQITEQGNRVADTTDKLKEYNQEIANMAQRELEAELQKALANELELREQIKEEQIQLNGLEEYETGLREIIRAHSDGTLDNVRSQLEIEKERLEEAYNEAVARGEVTDELSLQIQINEALLSLADSDVDKAREKLAEIMGQVDSQRELISEKEAELGQAEILIDRMKEVELISAGITEEAAKKAVQDGTIEELLDEQLSSLESQRRELENQYPAGLQMTDEYKNAKNEIDQQISKLQIAKSNIQGLTSDAEGYTEELGRDVEKNADVIVSPTIDAINRDLGESVTKTVNIRVPSFDVPVISGVSARLGLGGEAYQSYASGTDHHPGGPFIAGEEGWELGRLGRSWEILNPGLYDRPRGYEVFTHNESKRILGALNNLPGYASGTNMGAETNRIVRGLNNPMTDGSSKVVALLEVIARGIHEGKSIVIDGREVARSTHKHMKELDRREQQINLRAQGYSY